MKSITIDERNKWAMQRGFKGYLSLDEYNKKMYWDREDHEPMDQMKIVRLGIVNAEMKIARKYYQKRLEKLFLNLLL